MFLQSLPSPLCLRLRDARRSGSLQLHAAADAEEAHSIPFSIPFGCARQTWRSEAQQSSAMHRAQREARARQQASLTHATTGHSTRQGGRRTVLRRRARRTTLPSFCHFLHALLPPSPLPLLASFGASAFTVPPRRLPPRAAVPTSLPRCACRSPLVSSHPLLRPATPLRQQFLPPPVGSKLPRRRWILACRRRRSAALLSLATNDLKAAAMGSLLPRRLICGSSSFGHSLPPRSRISFFALFSHTDRLQCSAIVLLLQCRRFEGESAASILPALAGQHRRCSAADPSLALPFLRCLAPIPKRHPATAAKGGRRPFRSFAPDRAVLLLLFHAVSDAMQQQTRPSCSSHLDPTCSAATTIACRVPLPRCAGSSSAWSNRRL